LAFNIRARSVAKFSPNSSRNLTACHNPAKRVAGNLVQIYFSATEQNDELVPRVNHRTGQRRCWRTNDRPARLIFPSLFHQAGSSQRARNDGPDIDGAVRLLM
jgi:hypothetical protein